VTYQKILVRATNWLGDAVMSLPALRALRQRFPDAEIAILAKPWVADLYGREPFCDRMIPYTPRTLPEKWAAGRALASEHFDCAILLQNAFEAAAVAFAARIPERIGYARDGRSALLTRAIAVPRKGEIPRHERFYYLELLHRDREWIRTPSPIHIVPLWHCNLPWCLTTEGAAHTAAIWTWIRRWRGFRIGSAELCIHGKSSCQRRIRCSSCGSVRPMRRE